jgi:phage baseplate assembly protein W
MLGVHAQTGSALDGLGHLSQSIADIILTPVGSRVMRRTYGSRVPDLIDAPIGQRVLVDVTAAVATALERWEPRYRLDRLRLDRAGADGTVEITLIGRLTTTGETAVIQVPTGRAAA